MYKYFLPYDVFERHKKVGSFIEKNQSVLDVGGELNHLSQFCASKRLVVANLHSGDVIIPKEKIPFKKDSFDIVCSIDVIEHIPGSKRSDFIKKLIDIASKKVILSFPIGTKKHIAYERKMQKLLTKKEIDIDYLNEHIRYGLPTQEDVNKFTQGDKTQIYYAGNLNINKILLQIYLFDPKINIVRKAVYYSKMIFNLVTNQFLYSILINKDYSESVNRAYVIINKNK